MGIVLIYRSTRVINFAVGNMGLVGASLLALLVVNYERAVLAGRDSSRWSSARSSARSWSSIVDPAALQRAARDRARRDDRDRRAGAGDRHRATRRSTRRARTYPGRDRNDVGRRRRCAGHRCAARDPRRRARSSRSRSAGSSTAPRSADGQGIGREPRPRPRPGHQPEDRLDRGLGDRRLPGDAHDDRWSPARAGSAHDLLILGPNTLVRGSGRRRDRRHGVVPAGHGRRRRDRRGPGAHQLQLPRQARPDRRPPASSRSLVAVVLPEPTRDRGETQTFSFSAEGPRDPRAAARVWWVRHIDRDRPGPCSWWSPSCCRS